MNLVIFDFDGTLTKTHGRYDEYYAKAVEEALGIVPMSRNWDDYSAATDSDALSAVRRGVLSVRSVVHSSPIKIPNRIRLPPQR